MCNELAFLPHHSPSSATPSCSSTTLIAAAERPTPKRSMSTRIRSFLLAAFAFMLDWLCRFSQCVETISALPISSMLAACTNPVYWHSIGRIRVSVQGVVQYSDIPWCANVSR